MVYGRVFSVCVCVCQGVVFMCEAGACVCVENDTI